MVAKNESVLNKNFSSRIINFSTGTRGLSTDDRRRTTTGTL